MKALFVRARTGYGITESVVNLDLCSLIEFDAEKPSLDFWLGERGVVRFAVPDGVMEFTVMRRLRDALSPLYEGRMNQIMGIKLELDLTIQ